MTFKAMVSDLSCRCAAMLAARYHRAAVLYSSNKVNKGTLYSFVPDLISAGGSEIFTYAGRYGYWKRVDGVVFYAFSLTINNFLTAGATGSLSLSMPSPSSYGSSSNVIYLSATTNLASVQSVVLTTTGVITIKSTPATLGTLLTADMITSSAVGLYGQIFYFG